VLRLVRIVTGGLKRARRIDRRMGAWAWGLLGKVREVGECGSEEVGVLRELGKRAVWVLRGWREAEKRGGGGVGGVDEEQEEDEEGLEGGDDVGDEAMEETEIVHQQDDGGAENLDSGVLESGGVAAESEVDQGLVCDNDELFEPQVEVTSSHGTVAHPRAPEQELHEVQDEDNLAHDNAEDGHNHEIDELAAAKERVRVKLDESMYVAGMLDREAPEVEDATFATLDMIITVVGEFYGQRDLLEFRDLWDELLQ